MTINLICVQCRQSQLCRPCLHCTQPQLQTNGACVSSREFGEGSEGWTKCLHITLQSVQIVLFVRLLKGFFFFFADSFDPELIKSIVAKLLYINEILKTYCVQFAGLCQCSKDCTHVRSLYYMPEAASRSVQQ